MIAYKIIVMAFRTICLQGFTMYKKHGLQKQYETLLEPAYNKPHYVATYADSIKPVAQVLHNLHSSHR